MPSEPRCVSPQDRASQDPRICELTPRGSESHEFQPAYSRSDGTAPASRRQDFQLKRLGAEDDVLVPSYVI